MRLETLTNLGSGPDDECIECGYPTEMVCGQCAENVCDDCLESHEEWEHSDQESELK